MDIDVLEADFTATATAVLTIVQIVGLLVVAITLMGLVSLLSTGVIEWTREIGMPRCVGARARHIRPVVNVEAVVLATAGWLELSAHPRPCPDRCVQARSDDRMRIIVRPRSGGG